jgi:hypothetical protein
LKYEFIYEVKCSCGTFKLGTGIRDDENYDEDLFCWNCKEKYQKKKKWKRKINNKNEIVPEDEEIPV